MKKLTILLLAVSHLGIGFGGFFAGIYMLPVLAAPPAPTEAEIKSFSDKAIYTARFSRGRKDSDFLHWGEGELFIGPQGVALLGNLSPGPDYKLYLSPQFVETESDFMALKPTMQRIGDVKTFDNFIVPMPPGVDLSQYNSVIVWCEAFGQFVTSAQYH